MYNFPRFFAPPKFMKTRSNFYDCKFPRLHLSLQKKRMDFAVSSKIFVILQQKNEI